MSRNGLAVMTGAVALAIMAAAGVVTVLERMSRKARAQDLELAFKGSVGDGPVRPQWAAGGLERGLYPPRGHPRRDAERQRHRYLEITREVADLGAPEGVDEDAWAEELSVERSSGVARVAHTRRRWMRIELAKLDNGSTITVLSDIGDLKAVQRGHG